MASQTPVPVPAGLLNKVTVKLGSSAKVPGPSSVPDSAPVPAPVPVPVQPVYASILDIPHPVPTYMSAPVPAKDGSPGTVAIPAPASSGSAYAAVVALATGKAKNPKHAKKVHGSDLVPVPPAGVSGIDLVSAIGGTLFPIVLPSQLTDKIGKPITGSGGWQRVMADLQGALTHEMAGDSLVSVLKLTPHMLDRITTLSVKHGGGGYQATMRWIVCLAMDQHKSKLLGGVA